MRDGKIHTRGTPGVVTSYCRVELSTYLASESVCTMMGGGDGRPLLERVVRHRGAGRKTFLFIYKDQREKTPRLVD